jgi:hypothetical protein
MRFFASAVASFTLAGCAIAQQLSFNSPNPGDTLVAGNNYAISLSEADNIQAYQQLSAVFALSNVTFNSLQTLIPPVIDISQQGYFQLSTAPPGHPGFKHTFYVTIPWATSPGPYNLSVANWYDIGIGGSLAFSVSTVPIVVASG